MRWSLRYQIMAPMAALIVVSIVGLSVVQAYLAAESATQQIRRRLRDVMATLTESNFPLTEGVLRQMKGLAGADFVLADGQGKVQVGTRSMRATALDPKAIAGDWSFASPIMLDGRAFLHATASVQRGAGGEAVLHVLYPEDAYRDARRRALQPPLLIGALALLVVAGLGATIANRVTRPLRRLKDQVERVSQGTFAAMSVPDRHDEVRDLIVSINRMTTTLMEFEQRVRETERMRTLGQLGGGLAHQLRNAATGARMALDLHRRHCSLPDDEGLDVAQRQLVLMERYLQRFLRLGRPQPAQREPLELRALVAELVPLVEPAAQHAAVELSVDLPPTPVWLSAERDGMDTWC